MSIKFCKALSYSPSRYTHQLERIQEVAAGVALVATGIFIATTRARSLNESVRCSQTVSKQGWRTGFPLSSGEPTQKCAVDLAKGLGGHALLKPLVFPQLQEDLLDNLGVHVGAGPAKVVELDLEVVVDLLMQLVELIAQLAGGDAFLEGPI